MQLAVPILLPFVVESESGRPKYLGRLRGDTAHDRVIRAPSNKGARNFSKCAAAPPRVSRIEVSSECYQSYAPDL